MPDAPPHLNGNVKTAPGALLDDQRAAAPPAQPVPEEPAARNATPQPAQSGQADHPRVGLRDEIATGARSLLGWHGLRSTVIGVILASLAVALGIGSAVSVSLLVAGLVFLLIGILGPRLQGRFAVEFGPNGASIDLRTQLAPPGSAWLARPLLPPAKPTIALAAPAGDAGATIDTTAAALLLGEITDARSQTIELDTKSLQALLANPQNGKSPTA
jgi:hypothetical protein